MAQLPGKKGRNKQTITLRLDAAVVEWLRKQTGYNVRLNALLKRVMKRRGSKP